MKWLTKKDEVIQKVLIGEYTPSDISVWSKKNDLVAHNGQLLLRLLADRNDFASVRTLLKNAPIGGADIHTHDDYVLRLFIREGHFEEARWLLTSPDIDVNACIEAKGYMAFLSACRTGSEKTALFTIEFTDQKDKKFEDCIDESFCQACHYGQRHILSFLMENKDLTVRPKISPENEERAILGALRSQNQAIFLDVVTIFGGVDASNHAALRSVIPAISSSATKGETLPAVLKKELKRIFDLYKTPFSIKHAFAIIQTSKNPPKVREEIIYLLATSVPQSDRETILKSIKGQKISFAPLGALVQKQNLTYHVHDIIEQKPDKTNKRKI